MEKRIKDVSESEPRLYCRFCNRVKGWWVFHFGTPNETTPLICISCLDKGRVKRTFNLLINDGKKQ